MKKLQMTEEEQLINLYVFKSVILFPFFPLFTNNTLKNLSSKTPNQIDLLQSNIAICRHPVTVGDLSDNSITK